MDIIASRGFGGTLGRLRGRGRGVEKRTTRVSERHVDRWSDDSAAGSDPRATRAPSIPRASRVREFSGSLGKDSVPK
jgi:hypothetical protein